MYSGQDPQILEGDIFKIIVPLDDSYSFDARIGSEEKLYTKIGSQEKPRIEEESKEERVLRYAKEHYGISTKEVIELFGYKSKSGAKKIINKNIAKGNLRKIGSGS